MQVKVRRSFPLTSVECVEDDKDNTQVFRLVFQKTVMVLEASSPEDATEWVQKIKDGELPGSAGLGRVCLQRKGLECTTLFTLLSLDTVACNTNAH